MQVVVKMNVNEFAWLLTNLSFHFDFFKISNYAGCDLLKPLKILKNFNPICGAVENTC